MPVQKQSVVYKILNRINGKFYVGSTRDFSYRKSQHLRDLRKNRHHSPILQRAFNKYGEESFTFKIIEDVSDMRIIFVREQHYLDILKPEYNICPKVEAPPSRLGMKSTPEHCAHMSKALKGRPGTMKGKKFSEEHKKKISNSNKGNQNSLGHRHSQYSIELMKQKRALNPGRHPKDPVETRKKRVASLKTVWMRRSIEQRMFIRDKSVRARTILKETLCVVCQKKIVYHSNGSEVPRTCGSFCRSQLRREILAERRQNNPDMCREAAFKRWHKEKSQ